MGTLELQLLAGELANVDATVNGYRRKTFSRGYSGYTSFRDATFSGESVGFESPRAWNNVQFTWDYPGGGDLPQCIHPRDWPPQVDSS
jgi:hypothetical protein